MLEELKVGLKTQTKRVRDLKYSGYEAERTLVCAGFKPRRVHACTVFDKKNFGNCGGRVLKLNGEKKKDTTGTCDSGSKVNPNHQSVPMASLTSNTN